MKTKDSTPLPVHSLENGSPVSIRDISYKNPYDFTREHRHDYFEIFIFGKGGGVQLIDFNEYLVQPDSVYIVFPKQVHLYRRHPDSTGLIVQFREEVIPSVEVKNLLRQVSFSGSPAAIFENSREKIDEINPALEMLQRSSEKTGNLSAQITLNYLQAFLLQLIENRVQEEHARETKPGTATKNFGSEEKKLLFEFQHLLEENFRSNHSVSQYVSELNTTEKKLSAVTKKFLGLSPLQVIHERILLEAKRVLLFEESSHKEIAFSLGFDSPATFSQFIKTKTGYSPSDLVAQLVNIHK